MNNNQIIADSVLAAVGIEAVEALAASVYSPAQLAARRASIRVELDPGFKMTQEEADRAAFGKYLAVDLYHTFEGWKKSGYTVKKGEHAAVVAWIWKPKKPSKAEKEAEKILPSGPSLMAPEFVKCKAFLFGRDQVDKINK